MMSLDRRCRLVPAGVLTAMLIFPLAAFSKGHAAGIPCTPGYVSLGTAFMGRADAPASFPLHASPGGTVIAQVPTGRYVCVDNASMRTGWVHVAPVPLAARPFPACRENACVQVEASRLRWKRKPVTKECRLYSGSEGEVAEFSRSASCPTGWMRQSQVQQIAD